MIVPVGARVGYQHPLSARWSLRGSAHGVAVFDDETSKCGCGDGKTTLTRTFAFAELGARYESPGGFVAGVDLPCSPCAFRASCFHPRFRWPSGKRTSAFPGVSNVVLP